MSKEQAMLDDKDHRDNSFSFYSHSSFDDHRVNNKGTQNDY